MIEEIRLNSKYAVLYHSEFPEEGSDEEKWQNAKRIENRLIVPTEQILEEFKRKFSNRAIKYEGILPMNCRYAYEDVNGTSLFVIEEPPAIRTIKIDFSMSKYIADAQERGMEKEWGEIYDYVTENNGDSMMLNLAFPYILHFIKSTRDFRYTGGYVFFKSSPLVGFGDFLCKPMLPNISTNHRICMGDGMGGNRYNSTTQMVQHYMHYFWNNAYNRDYFYFPNEYFRLKVPYVSNIIEWAYRTKYDPSFIFKARWLPARPKLFGTLVNKILRNNRLIPPENIHEPTFKKITHIFTKSIPSQETTDDTPPQPMKDNVSSSISLLADGSMLLFVGDVFEYNGTEVQVLSFLSSTRKSTPTHMRLAFKDDGSVEVRRLTRQLKDQIIEYFKQKYEKSNIKLNGVTYKVEDIVKVMRSDKDAPKFRKIDGIRTFNGVDEMNLGGQYYIAKNIKLEKYNVDNIKLGDITLNKDKDYILSRASRNLNFQKFQKMKFIGVNVSPRGSIVLRFKYEHNGLDKIIDPEIDYNSYQELDLSKMENTKEPIRVFDNYIQIDKIEENDVLYYTKEKIYYSSTRRLTTPKFGDIIKKWYDGKSISIPGHDFDISYNVGDIVVCADWVDPLEMLKIKRIIGFKVDELNLKLLAILQDKHENISECVIIDGICGLIEAMKLRKVMSKYKSIQIGMKIKSKVNGITGFPKEATNIIVAIIGDMNLKEPIILCSNGLTLWASDVLSKFRKMKMGTSTWNKYDHEELDTSKIELQEGDLFMITDGPFKSDYRYHIFMKDEKLFCSNLENIENDLSANEFHNIYKAYALPYGILLPRWSSEQNSDGSDNEIEMIRGNLSLNGMIRPNDDSPLYYPKDTRRIFDV